MKLNEAIIILKGRNDLASNMVVDALRESKRREREMWRDISAHCSFVWHSYCHHHSNGVDKCAKKTCPLLGKKGES